MNPKNKYKHISILFQLVLKNNTYCWLFSKNITSKKENIQTSSSNLNVRDYIFQNSVLGTQH